MGTHSISKYKTELIFIGICFTLYWIWASTIPFNGAPDEQMKWNLINYIFKTGVYPPGYEPMLIDPDYGRSYAFEPALAYLVEALLVKLWSFFSANADGYYMAARLFSILLSCGTIFVLFRIGSRLFNKSTKWLFVCTIALLPQYAFLSSYINCDIFAIFCCSVIIYYCIRAMESRWAWKDCLGLGLGIGLCLLSYYFAYPLIAASVFFFLSTTFIWRRSKQNTIIKNHVAAKAFTITGTAALIAGWYFVRNILLYDGDIFTRVASRDLAEIHAAFSMRPSVRMTPQHMQVTIGYMLINMGWLTNSAKSFLGVFGYMNISFPNWVYGLVSAVLTVFCIAGLRIKKWLAVNIKWKLFTIALTAALVGNLFLSLYYSYFEDFQPQGRYLMEGILIPIFLLFAIGADHVNDILFKNSKFKVQYVLIGLMALFNVFSYKLI
ncbi:MAG: DUF2142 domain-containing protein [Eubacteriales bacterium]